MKFGIDLCLIPNIYLFAFYVMHFFVIGMKMNYFLIIAFMTFPLFLLKIARLSCFLQTRTIYQLSILHGQKMR